MRNQQNLERKRRGFLQVCGNHKKTASLPLRVLLIAEIIMIAPFEQSS